MNIDINKLRELHTAFINGARHGARPIVEWHEAIIAAGPALIELAEKAIDRPVASGDVRERFEAWHLAEGHPENDLDGYEKNQQFRYYLPEIQERWEVWQAASAERALVVGLSEEQIKAAAITAWPNLPEQWWERKGEVRKGVEAFARNLLAAANGEQK